MPLPPGPKPLPLVGNVLDLPPSGVPEFKHWFRHKDKYGPVSSVTLMGLVLVIIHDKEVAYSLLSKKAQKTAARPQFNFASLAGFEQFLITHQYNDTYRLHRKMVHHKVGTKSLSDGFRPIQEREATLFVLQVYKNPAARMVHSKTLAAAVIVKVMYGYEIERDGRDPLCEVIEHAMDNLSQAFVPLKWAVDAIPAIQYLPDGVPGTGSRKTAAEYAKVNYQAANLPYAFVKQQMQAKTERPSYVANLLKSQAAKHGGMSKLPPEEEGAIKWTAVSMYAAGSDSTVAIMQSVICALLIHPESVTRAHEEIDRVVGSSRLPTFADRKNLPYVDGIIKEAWRWNPVGPMGLAHRSEEEMIIKGDIAFGYGRGSCAGRFFADASVYITMVQFLACFDIRKARDANGREIPVKLEPVAGMVNRPKPFAWEVEIRSAKHTELLEGLKSMLEQLRGDSALLDLA
ncbi:uncharacterized protein MYCFIDRAFT_201210 [Pseudocercospora fijiensis CIRAD86]|uniref:Cytochrome P450 n=1 Tax=Pseudocercospora fijiensis (strain CIRAD86) TaxID=383855 RepID=N1Q640_PSEFD|nr:uncharacterized protein MYCFIDRAFT_201210 [Pseudocercospora fijiensis CIRAD86]EME87650.1 hypothetical protein MYCFIDRAFT_201210 [Pseudocercospora fijiensis CIRAD86]